jgi:hypothetical protein
VAVDAAKRKAMEAAARLNAQFAAPEAAAESETETDKMGINHLSTQKRFLLCKKQTAEACLEKFGVTVLVKGVYHANEQEVAPAEPPLYLQLTGPSLSALSHCTQYLKELQNAEEVFVSGRVVIPIPGASPFNVVSKIVGPGGEFVKHIKRQANCQIQVAGKDCGIRQFSSEEPLHIKIDAHSEEGLQKAKQLTQDLIDHVLVQYQDWQKDNHLNAPPPSSAHHHHYQHQSVNYPQYAPFQPPPNFGRPSAMLPQPSIPAPRTVAPPPPPPPPPSYEKSTPFSAAPPIVMPQYNPMAATVRPQPPPPPPPPTGSEGETAAKKQKI